MRSYLRVVAAALSSLALLMVVSPMSAQAATVTVPAPVEVPAGISDWSYSPTPQEMMDDDWDAWYRREKGLSSVPSAVTTGAAASKVGLGAKVVGGASAVGAIVAAVDLGTRGGVAISSALGLPTSGSFWCDLSTAVSNSGCGLASSPAYVADSDITVGEPGWSDGNVITGPANTTMKLSVDAAAVYGGTASVKVAGIAQADCYRPLSNYGHFWQNATIRALGESGSSVVEISGGVNGALISTTGTGWCATGKMVAGTMLQFVQRVSVRLVGIRVSVDGGDPSTYWLPGTPQRTALDAANDPHPQRTWRTDTLCSTSATHTERSSSFSEADPEWPGMPQPKCDTGAVTGYKIWQETAAKPDTLVFEWTSPVPSVKEKLATDYPDCAGSKCQLILSRVLSDTQTVSCFSQPDLCADWWTETQKGTLTSTEYACTYGAYAVALKECATYSRLFKDGKYSSPKGTDTTGSTPAEQTGCPPKFSAISFITGWWVYKGVQCALVEAFVPKSLGGKMTTLRAQFAASSVGTWSAAVGGIFDAPVTESGCLGPRARWDYANLDIYPFNACNAPMSTYAAWCKILLSGGIVIFGGMACVRGLGAGFGWKPSAAGDS